MYIYTIKDKNNARFCVWLLYYTCIKDVIHIYINFFSVNNLHTFLTERTEFHLCCDANEYRNKRLLVE